VSTDVRNRSTQTFWSMLVEAMNWGGMGVREYAAALTPYASRKWRDRLDEGEVEIDSRAHLHPSARPIVPLVPGTALLSAQFRLIFRKLACSFPRQQGT
jgi:hypothetical protein